jgi:hypothetical protein
MITLRDTHCVSFSVVFTSQLMQYQINYNRGFNTPVCATEYTYADSFDEAWVKGDCMAQYPEQVCNVFPIINDPRS